MEADLVLADADQRPQLERLDPTLMKRIYQLGSSMIINLASMCRPYPVSNELSPPFYSSQPALLVLEYP